MGDGSGLSFWEKVPAHRGHPGTKLLILLSKLFSTHGKEIAVWQSGQPEFDSSRELYISKIEVHPKGKYDW